MTFASRCSFLPLCGAVVCLLTTQGCQKRSPSEPAPTATSHAAALPADALGWIEEKWQPYIKVATVTAYDGQLQLNTTGKIGFDDDHTQHVTTPVDGRVAAIKVSLGQQVNVGEPLVELSSSRVAELQSDAKKEQQDLEVAERSLQRAHKLRADGAVSDKELSQAHADLNKARAEVERAQAQLAALGIHKGDPVVRAALFARVDGTVVQRNISVGQEVRADSGTPLLTLTNLDHVWVTADVYEQDLGVVQKKAPVELTVTAYPGQRFLGAVAYVGDIIDSQSRTVKVRCDIANPNHLLKPEMFAKAAIAYESTADKIFIPTRSLISDGEKTQVLVVGEQQAVYLRQVQAGSELGGRQQILDGLRLGERIVVDGAVFLRNALGD
jgi:cobalt-zinc-cadmium efflux system membrane fusion protein